jgi:hypothetical protein
MYSTSYDIARLRVDDMLRDADHRRLVKEAKAARKAARSEDAGFLASVRHASAGALRLAPWKRDRSPRTTSAPAPAQLVAAHPTPSGA